MKWLRIWRFLRGYVIIRLKGCRLESFAEALRARGVPVWDAKQLQDGATLSTTLEGARIAQEIRERKKRGTLTVKTCGMRALLSSVRCRAALAGALIAAFAGLLFFLQFVWIIDLRDVPSALREDVRAKISACVPRIPVLKRTIDEDALADRMALSFPQFSWTDVSLDGISLVVRAALRTPAPSVFPNENAGAIVADCDAVIESIAVFNGTAQVSEGDIVKKGDVLISGIAGRAGYERVIQASGKVVGRVWYHDEVTVPFDKIDTLTGRRDTACSLVVMGHEIPLRAWKEDFSTYREEERCVYIPSPEMGIALFVKTKTRSESQRPDAQTLLFRARQIALSKVQALVAPDAGVIETDFEQTIKKDGVHVACTLTARKDLGVLQEVYQSDADAGDPN